MSAAEWIAQRRELLDAATEGPWCYGGQGWVFAEALLRSGSGEPRGMRDLLASVGSSDEDALFIADARTSLPRALNALEAALVSAKRHRDFAIKRGRDACTCTICDMCRAIEAALRGES